MVFNFLSAQNATSRGLVSSFSYKHGCGKQDGVIPGPSLLRIFCDRNAWWCYWLRKSWKYTFFSGWTGIWWHLCSCCISDKCIPKECLGYAYNIISVIWCDGDKVHEDRKVYACWTCSWFKYCTSCSHVLPADEKVTVYVFVNNAGSCSREQADVCKSSFVVPVFVLIFLLGTYYKFT